MKTLVFVEHHGGELQKGSLGVLAKAASLGGDVGAVLVGAGVKALAPEVARYGATTVHVAEDAALDPPLPQPRVDVIATVVADGGYDTVLFANSVLAADIAAGLAARLDAGLNWDLATSSSRTARSSASVRRCRTPCSSTSAGRPSRGSRCSAPARSTPPRSRPAQAQVVDVAVSLEEHSQLAKIVDQEHEESSGPSIEDADVIVAGGRGLGGPESFTLAEELARALGGAVGATRAVVDAGWYPYSAQIGQTGKTVSPKLYVALGISGAIQHKVGMQSSNTIVAINKDANAPIFEFSDLGVVGDLHEIVPKLTELVKQQRGG